MKSTPLAAIWLQKAVEDFKRRPRFWIGLSWSYGIFVWISNSIPWAGMFIGSLASTFLLSSLYGRLTKERIPSVFFLGILNTPSVIMWVTLGSFLANTNWLELFSSAWALPIAFFGLISTWVITASLGFVFQGLSLDPSIKKAWMCFVRNLRPLLGLSITGSALICLGFVSRGWAWPLLLPALISVLAVSAQQAILSSPATSPQQDAGSTPSQSST